MPAPDPSAPAKPDLRHAGAQKVFFLVFTDPVQLTPDEIRPHLEPHKQWVVDLESAGRLFAAGPLLDDDYEFSGSGLMVLRASSFAEAKEIIDSDPFHQHDIRQYRLVPWQVNEGTLDVKMTLSSGSFELL
jgi:uncharacterized protein YciI